MVFCVIFINCKGLREFMCSSVLQCSFVKVQQLAHVVDTTRKLNTLVRMTSQALQPFSTFTLAVTRQFRCIYLHGVGQHHCGFITSSILVNLIMHQYRNRLLGSICSVLEMSTFQAMSGTTAHQSIRYSGLRMHSARMINIIKDFMPNKLHTESYMRATLFGMLSMSSVSEDNNDELHSTQYFD